MNYNAIYNEIPRNAFDKSRWKVHVKAWSEAMQNLTATVMQNAKYHKRKLCDVTINKGWMTFDNF